jgi:hypothetical protein
MVLVLCEILTFTIFHTPYTGYNDLRGCWRSDLLGQQSQGRLKFGKAKKKKKAEKKQIFYKKKKRVSSS